MKIKLWGVRGSLPAPLTTELYHHRLRSILERAFHAPSGTRMNPDDFIASLPPELRIIYGGNTTCIEVQAGNHHTSFILDMGTGVRLLGDHYMQHRGYGDGGREIHIFVTHTHWDHIQGFPFFVPAYIPGNTLHFYSPYKNLETRLKRQQRFEHFPVGIDKMPSNKQFHFISPETSLTMDGVTISCFPLEHPGGSYAYRFREKDKVFIFATDSEFTMKQIDAMDTIAPFFENADLLLIDSQYTLEEAFYKFDWGHTSFSMAVNLGVRWNVRRLVLTHHDPANSDDKLAKIHEDAKQHRSYMHKEDMIIDMAIEGTEYEL